MKLTQTERERITDSVLKIQSVRESMRKVDTTKVPEKKELEECLDRVDRNFRQALGYVPSKEP